MIFGLALSVGAITLVSSPPTTASATYGDLATFGFIEPFLFNIVRRVPPGVINTGG